MGADAKRLARLHRVRTLQLNLARADEAAARGRHASEAALAQRIGQLAQAVSPGHGSAAAIAMAAGAHYRQRLAESAAAADERVRTAGDVAARAAEATRLAHRDRTAIEKLMARAELDEALGALRALEEAPPAQTARSLLRDRA